MPLSPDGEFEGLFKEFERFQNLMLSIVNGPGSLETLEKEDIVPIVEALRTLNDRLEAAQSPSGTLQ